MKNFLMTENEKKRILNMHKSSLYTLSEQPKPYFEKMKGFQDYLDKEEYYKQFASDEEREDYERLEKQILMDKGRLIKIKPSPDDTLQSFADQFKITPEIVKKHNPNVVDGPLDPNVELTVELPEVNFNVVNPYDKKQ